MTYHRVCTKSNMMGVTCVAETAYPAGAPGISLRFFIYLSGFRVVHVLKLHVFTFFVPCCYVRCDFRVKNYVRFALFPNCFVDAHVLFMLFVFIYVYWCPTQFPYQMMFVSSNGNTTVLTCGAGTAYHSGAPEFNTIFSGVRVTRS
jgi:hypothetical protein